MTNTPPLRRPLPPSLSFISLHPALSSRRLLTHSLICAAASTRPAPRGRPHRRSTAAPLRMVQEKSAGAEPNTAADPEPAADLDPAERTRRALNASAPLVKFRKDAGPGPGPEAPFAYTAGVKSGLDIWLLTGLLVFLVPFVIFWIYVQNGTIDLAPR